MGRRGRGDGGRDGEMKRCGGNEDMGRDGGRKGRGGGDWRRGGCQDVYNSGLL